MTFLLEFCVGLALLLLAMVLCLVSYARWHYGSLESLNIPVVPPHWLLGSNYNGHKLVYHLEDMARVKKLGPVYGVYEGRLPVVYISDPELIRAVCTNPDHFDKRKWETGIPLMDEIVELIPTGDKWRAVRSHLTPILTTGKLRGMHEQMVDIADEHIEVLRGKLTKEGSKIDFGQFLPPLAIEMIGKTLCGIKFENTQDPNNQLVKSMKEMFDGGASYGWMYAVIMTFPFLLNFFPGPAKDHTKFFEDTIRSVLDGREASGVKHPDMVGKLLEMRQKIPTPEYQKMGITEITVHGQAFELFIASFLGIVTEINYFLYFMALNPDHQERVVQEIDSVTSKSGGKLDLSAIGDFHYLAACLSETFRIQSAFFRPERVCIRDWQHDGGHGLRIKKGMSVTFPLYAVHHNPDLYPEPSRFDPDRFMEGGGASTNSYAFITFGGGPRACIGTRYIYDMMKIFLVKFFQEFRVAKRNDTVWNVKPGSPMTLQHDPIYLDLVKR